MKHLWIAMGGLSDMTLFILVVSGLSSFSPMRWSFGCTMVHWFPLVLDTHIDASLRLYCKFNMQTLDGKLLLFLLEPSLLSVHFFVWPWHRQWSHPETSGSVGTGIHGATNRLRTGGDWKAECADGLGSGGSFQWIRKTRGIPAFSRRFSDVCSPRLPRAVRRCCSREPSGILKDRLGNKPSSPCEMLVVWRGWWAPCSWKSASFHPRHWGETEVQGKALIHWLSMGGMDEFPLLLIILWDLTLIVGSC